MKESNQAARYDPQAIETEAQRRWAESGIFAKAPTGAVGKAFYCLEMFPYPSGKLHMGHVRNYTIGDAIARFQRMNGREVLYPMGFDSFGLPAENAAISGKAHPREWTFARIEEMTGQLRRMGFSYDWNRLTVTCKPDYYRWNQWFFLEFMKRDLVYRKESPVNWCPKCETVLANEQVHDGRCWRHEDTEVITKNLAQWFFRTTAYAERLLGNLEKLTGWPEHVREMQRHWIGRSEGAVLRFPSPGPEEIVIETFTTRPDTVYGITYLVLAPEHPLVDRLVSPERRDGLETFRREVGTQTTAERTDATRPKHGYALGRDFVNPFTGTRHPLFVADYALMDYGTGAVMAVPAHDQRDFEFARAHGLPIKPVIHPAAAILRAEEMTAAYEEAGVMRDSGDFDGQASTEARHGIVRFAEEQGWGRPHVTYRLRDWLVSRQRYWGTPIPIVYCDACGIQPAAELPVLLPDDIDFRSGGNPLASSQTFVRTTCSKCGGAARRETDTMDTFVDSSWYFLRYCDPKNEAAPFSPEVVRNLMPVDQYIGGVEHACMHLIYARWFTMVLHDMGLVAIEEPFTNLLTQGMVSLETYRCPVDDYILPTECVDGKCAICGSAVTIGRIEKMSKSKKNTIDPGEIIGKYGADTARCFILFAAPPENELLWSDQAVEGAWRFLRRIHDLVEERVGRAIEAADAAADRPDGGSAAGAMDGAGAADRPDGGSAAGAMDGAGAAEKELRRKTHETIGRVTRDIAERFQFNTAIAALMELLNAIQAHGRRTAVSDESLRALVLCLAPIAPHLAEHCWSRLGGKELVSIAPWPAVDAAALVTETVEIPVQVNGKLRGRITIQRGASEAEVVATAAGLLALDPASIGKAVYRPEKILNLVVRSAP